MIQKKVHITFVLPSFVRYPVGGFKVIFEYANGLAQRGHRVSIVFPAIGMKNVPFGKKIFGMAKYFLHCIDKAYFPDAWFKLDSKVNVVWVATLAERYIPEADVIVGSAWQTAEWISDYPKNKGEKFYLLQHFENWSGSSERVLSTWKLPLKKIAIAKWLVKMARDIGEVATHIPNGLDFNAFGMDVIPENRKPNTIVMLHHKLAWKGFEDGFNAVSIVKDKVPDLELVLFGVNERPDGLPDWVTYYRNPPQIKLRNIYNKAAIVVAPSWVEGWGLVPCEGLMCGCALVATDVGGHQEFAIHEKTALLSKPKTPVELAANILELLRNQDKRIRLAYSGYEHIQQFTWERAITAFENEIVSTITT